MLLILVGYLNRSVLSPTRSFIDREKRFGSYVNFAVIISLISLFPLLTVMIVSHVNFLVVRNNLHCYRL
jgi:nitrate reductase NapE component